MSADRDRFERVFRAHYAAVTRYAIRRVGVDGADDVVAETFLVAWRRLDRVPTDALPWLYATARRVIANERRRHSRAERLGKRVEAEPRSASPDPGESVTDGIRVRMALATLSERDREVLLLTEWEQLGAAEAAHVLGCTKASFTVRLHRARRRLGRALEDNEPVTALVAEGGTA